MAMSLRAVDVNVKRFIKWCGSPYQFMGGTESASGSDVGSDQSPHSTLGDSPLTLLPNDGLEGIDPTMMMMTLLKVKTREFTVRLNSLGNKMSY
ncbi:hypothetical protein CRG98_008014 [Punica granatum]|uniref:Uncharacterized protein n=1 Tax=Punica granatum TaxID=22663 RepID=A0A2I0KUT8_PUNGR|nr:hypothetical protein CRG98_008014 [Punica granatum]